jgi:predicted 2-oxoglutarate/Fe(II)-dependent dioxygenase YbiX
MEIYLVDGLPVAHFKNFYDEVACEKIWQELCFLNNDVTKLQPENITGSAWKEDDHGERVLLKKNTGLFLDGVYLNRSVSNILTENRKIFSESIINELTSNHIFFNYLKNSNFDSTLVNYYENSNYYDFHSDNAILTSLCWFYKKPKAYRGGELSFKNDLTLNCNYNDYIIFPSILDHSVKEVKLEESFQNQNYGRYSIAQFITINLKNHIFQHE